MLEAERAARQLTEMSPNERFGQTPPGHCSPYVPSTFYLNELQGVSGNLGQIWLPYEEKLFSICTNFLKMITDFFFKGKK